METLIVAQSICPHDTIFVLSPIQAIEAITTLDLARHQIASSDSQAVLAVLSCLQSQQMQSQDSELDASRQIFFRSQVSACWGQQSEGAELELVGCRLAFC